MHKERRSHQRAQYQTLSIVWKVTLASGVLFNVKLGRAFHHTTNYKPSTPNMSLFRPILLRTRLTAPTRSTCLRYSTTTTEPTVLPRLQSDLKTALRSKNKPALTVIRSIQAEIINASKTAKPVTTDGALYSIIQKQIKGSTTAIHEFEAAKRDDLVQKEQEQLDVLNGYASEIPKVEESEVDGLIAAAVEKLEEGKRNVGSVMGRVMGALKGRPADMEYLNRKIAEAVGKK
jgi:uncharacterized protein YqeY